MSVLSFIYGATAMASVAIAVFFLRFWRDTRDRLFLLFAIAFTLQAVNRLALATIDVTAENVPYLYSLRLVVFGLIAFAVLDKNRSRP
jgi:hypothetical protein